MKKIFYIAVSLLALAACTRETDIEVPAGNMTITARTETSVESRTIVEGETHVYWEPGDEIKVFSDGKSGKFTTDITESSASATFNGSPSLTDGAEIWAVYPYAKDASFDGETITTTLPSEQVARYRSFGKRMNLSIAHSSSNNLQFYNVGGGIRFRLTQKGIKSVTFEGYGGEILAGTVKIGFDENGLPVVSEVTNGSKAITILPPPGNDSFPTNVWFYCVAIPGSLASGYKLEFYRESEYSRSASEKAVTIKRSIFGSIDNADEGCEFIPIPNTISTPEIVDLGLSVKWASFNLGASSPEENGDYFAWGETEPYYISLDPLMWKQGKEKGYAWDSYKWYVDGEHVMKYNTDPELGSVDGKTVLDPEDDAAHVKLGGRWRMPTMEEWIELRTNCTLTWTTENGRWGYKVTSNKTGYTNKSIFIPAAGGLLDTGFSYAVDASVDYWSSSLFVEMPYSAWFETFYPDFPENFEDRYTGFSIRPVYAE